MMATIALVACVKDKQDKPCPAKDMYQGNDFESWMQYASKNADIIYILSGKYGLLELDTVIEPYDVNLNSKSENYRKVWSQTIIDFLSKHHDIKKDHFLVLTNAIYAEHLLPYFTSWEMPITID